eukprot:2465940-Alexandrium_andersonii.AAC.1
MEEEQLMSFEVGDGEDPAGKDDTPPEDTVIPCAACDRQRHGKKKWCLVHNRGPDCLMRQAAREDKANKTTHE